MLAGITRLNLLGVMLRVGGSLVDKVRYLTVIAHMGTHTYCARPRSEGGGGLKSGRHNEVLSVPGRKTCVTI